MGSGSASKWLLERVQNAPYRALTRTRRASGVAACSWPYYWLSGFSPAARRVTRLVFLPTIVLAGGGADSELTEAGWARRLEFLTSFQAGGWIGRQFPWKGVPLVVAEMVPCRYEQQGWC